MITNITIETTQMLSECVWGHYIESKRKETTKDVVHHLIVCVLISQPSKDWIERLCGEKGLVQFSELWTMGYMSPHCLKSFIVPYFLFLLSYLVTPLPIVQDIVAYCNRILYSFPYYYHCNLRWIFFIFLAANTKIVICHSNCILTGQKKHEMLYILFILPFLLFANQPVF